MNTIEKIEKGHFNFSEFTEEQINFIKYKQWLTYYVRRMLPEHKCKYCGCMTRQPDSECYAAPK